MSANYLLTMYFLMTGAAKSNAIGYYISKAFVGFPFFDVMGLKIVLFVNGSSPFFILIATAFPALEIARIL